MLVEDSSVILGLEFREIQGIRHCNSMTIVYGSLSEEGTPLFGKKNVGKLAFLNCKHSACYISKFDLVKALNCYFDLLNAISIVFFLYTWRMGRLVVVSCMISIQVDYISLTGYRDTASFWLCHNYTCWRRRMGLVWNLRNRVRGYHLIFFNFYLLSVATIWLML